jgi:hypothetical protein
METSGDIKIAHTTNLPTLNIKSQLSMNIDSNTSIKQVLNIETSLIESQIEPMQNKALIKGTLGIKVVYVDIDNILNSLSETATFSETLSSEHISPNCQINISSSQFIAEFENDERFLKVNIDGNINCFYNLNVNIKPFNLTDNNLITKKIPMQACSCVEKINTTTNFDYNFKLDYKIAKILSYDSKIVLDDTKCCDGYVLLNGQIINTIICEIDGSENNIKITTNSTPFKCEVEASSSNGQCFADMSAYINLNSTQITTDISDNYTQLNFEYNIVANGNIYKNIDIDVVDDLYSLNNFVEVINREYSICKKMPYFKNIEAIDSEISLSDEIIIDEIVGMVSTSCNIIQHTIKDGYIYLEGVVNGNLIYLDENREIKHLTTQLPYSINIKNETIENVCNLNLSASPISCKCKIKRGNTLIVDYDICVSGSMYVENKLLMIDNVKYGNPIKYNDIAFQIYIARQGENCWDLCKRIHISKEHLIQCNKETPEIYSGGEKVIVYR